MSLNYLQRTLLVGSLVGCAGFSLWYTLKPKAKASKQLVSTVRQDLLKDPNIRMLYSTMSFFYLQGFQQNNLQSFYRMKQILKIDKPSSIVLDLSQQQHDRTYVKVMNHPKFKESIQKFDYYLDNKKQDQIREMKEFDLEHLQKLYLLNYCMKQRCKIVFAQESDDYYQQLDQTYNSLLKQNVFAQKSQTTREINYVQKSMDILKPATGWRIFMPSTPFKTIYGVIRPELLNGVAQRWKDKFKTDYGHQIIEDEAVIERQKSLLDAKKFGHY